VSSHWELEVDRSEACELIVGWLCGDQSLSGADTAGPEIMHHVFSTKCQQPRKVPRGSELHIPVLVSGVRQSIKPSRHQIINRNPQQIELRMGTRHPKNSYPIYADHSGRQTKKIRATCKSPSQKHKKTHLLFGSSTLLVSLVCSVTFVSLVPGLVSYPDTLLLLCFHSFCKLAADRSISSLTAICHSSMTRFCILRICSRADCVALYASWFLRDLAHQAARFSSVRASAWMLSNSSASMPRQTIVNWRCMFLRSGDALRRSSDSCWRSFRRCSFSPRSRTWMAGWLFSFDPSLPLPLVVDS
jgi:hypothetical protein